MIDDNAVILASASRIRGKILAAAEISFHSDPAGVDEAAVRDGMIVEGAHPRDIVDMLAELKAVRISSRHGGRFVIGADQILFCEGKIFNKPGDIEEARMNLLALRGKKHVLHTVVCVAREGAVIWRHHEAPELTMRSFSDAFLDWYLAKAGEDVLTSVGAYHLEKLGSQLFEKIEGNYFSILGLPLLPLLNFLREHRIVRT